MEHQKEQPILKQKSDPTSESTFYADVKFNQPQTKLEHRSLIKDQLKGCLKFLEENVDLKEKLTDTDKLLQELVKDKEMMNIEQFGGAVCDGMMIARRKHVARTA